MEQAANEPYRTVSSGLSLTIEKALSMMKNKWYISFLDVPQRVQIHTVMDAESLGHIPVIRAMSSLLHSLDGEQRQAISGVWCGAPFHLTWCFLDNCCSIKLIHNDGRLEGPLCPAPVFPARAFAFPSWSNKINVSFHMKGGTKKSRAAFLRNIVLPVIPDESKNGPFKGYSLNTVCCVLYFPLH